MIKIEVTGNSIPEVADKLLAIGASLRASGTLTEVAEAAPPPKPQAPSTKSSTPVESTSTGQPSAPSEQEAASPLAPASPTPPPSASELSFETDVTPVVLAVVQTKGKPVVEEILSQFGVARASQLDPARWPELLAALKDQL
jgi:type IV secretory pathway VirB10-like protein